MNTTLLMLTPWSGEKTHTLLAGKRIDIYALSDGGYTKTMS